MILRNKSPETGIGRLVTVISHHPVIIHLKGITIGRLPIHQYNRIPYFQSIPFVNTYDSFIQRQSLQIQFYPLSFFRYIQRTEIIYIPGIIQCIKRKISGLIPVSSLRTISVTFGNAFNFPPSPTSGANDNKEPACLYQPKQYPNPAISFYLKVSRSSLPDNHIANVPDYRPSRHLHTTAHVFSSRVSPGIPTPRLM